MAEICLIPYPEFCILTSDPEDNLTLNKKLIHHTHSLLLKTIKRTHAPSSYISKYTKDYIQRFDQNRTKKRGKVKCSTRHTITVHKVMFLSIISFSLSLFPHSLGVDYFFPLAKANKQKGNYVLSTSKWIF